MKRTLIAAFAMIALAGCGVSHTAPNITSSRLADMTAMGFASPGVVKVAGTRDGAGTYFGAFGARGCWVYLAYGDPIKRGGHHPAQWYYKAADGTTYVITSSVDLKRATALQDC